MVFLILGSQQSYNFKMTEHVTWKHLGWYVWCLLIKRGISIFNAWRRFHQLRTNVFQALQTHFHVCRQWPVWYKMFVCAHAYVFECLLCVCVHVHLLVNLWERMWSDNDLTIERACSYVAGTMQLFLSWEQGPQLLEFLYCTRTSCYVFQELFFIIKDIITMLAKSHKQNGS